LISQSLATLQRNLVFIQVTCTPFLSIDPSDWATSKLQRNSIRVYISC